MRYTLCAMLVIGFIIPVTISAQVPVIDHHQHLFSPEAAALITGEEQSPGIRASYIVALLDSAGIRHALVISGAYSWGKASRAPVDNEYDHVRAENDWTAKQVVPYSNRLRAFCSVNPLKPYAIDEISRCSNIPQLHHGLKLHFGNSDVDLDDPDCVVTVRRIFETANSCHMAILVHMRTSLDLHRRYGADAARVFLNELLPAAPDVPVQIAHLAGAGGFDATIDSALCVFADAIERKDPYMKNVWFDVTTVVEATMSPDKLQEIAVRIRQLGVERVLYGSDAAVDPRAYPKARWEVFRRLPLTETEFRVIANNVAPYMRDFPAQ